MNEYIVFIISHKKPDEVRTLKALNDSGFFGDYRIIVDSWDETVEKYEKNYPGKIEIFDKSEIKKTFDVMDNFNIFSSAVYARNFSYELAKKLGYKYFILLDDDLTKFMYVFTEGEKFKKLQIKNINAVFENIVNYLEKSNSAICSISLDGGNFGGPKGRYSKGCGRSICACMICNSEKNCRFCGTQNEDFNLSIKYFQDITLEFYFLAVNTPQRGSNSDMYENVGFYKSSFYSFMLRPSGVKLSYKNGHFTMKRYSRKLFPKILSDSWKLN